MHPLTFSLFVSLGLKGTYRQHIYKVLVFIYSLSLCLFVETSTPLTIKVIINKYVPIAIFLIVVGVFFFFFPLATLVFYSLMTIFSVVFGLFFLVCVYLLYF